MNRTIRVHLGEEAKLVGSIRYDAQGTRVRAAFIYDASWIEATSAFAIDPTLPLVAGPQFHRPRSDGSIFHGAIADTEPDGWGRRVILRDQAKRRDEARKAGEPMLPPPSPLDLLLAIDDHSRVGALRFADEQNVFQRTSDPDRRTAPPLIELQHLLSASRAVETSTETAADLAYLRRRGTSLGGLRPKCTVIDDDGALSIGKFPSVTDQRAVTKGEVLALRLARAAGINAATARLVESDGVPVALIRRFDRVADGGRILYVSAATMLGVGVADPEDHAYTEIVDVIRQRSAAAQADIEELWRRIAFSILISNFDDHLRNHGFLSAGHGLWRLAPAFDLNPCPDRMRELTTWISEDAGPAATVSGLMSAGPYFRMKKERCNEILDAVEAAVATWRSVGTDLGMTAAELEPFAEAFEHHERRRR
jgi:serine/threonine-protein kinase HipA